MHPIHDVDVLVLQAMALSSKRRPAELVEIVAAVELVKGSIPTESKLDEAFHRLSMHGLISDEAGHLALTPDAQEIVAAPLRKALGTEERAFMIKVKLAAYEAKGEHAPILITKEQLSAAILAHKASQTATGKNLLVPKPKPAADNRPGQRQRKPLAKRRRKD